MATSRSDELPQLIEPGITRIQIIERARTWLRNPVAYSQTGFHENELGTYRTDCSGYVSMAWALPGKPTSRHGGLDAVGLAAVSYVIEKAELLAGDVLIRTDGDNLTRHVVIFDKWLDDNRAAYWGFEQAGGIGTVYRAIAYPYDCSPAAYQPRRYVGVNDMEQQ